MNTTACQPCTIGRHIDCTAEAGDCTNICHPGYDPEWSVEPVGLGNEFAVYVRGRGRCVMQSRDMAESEAQRIVRNIHAGER